MGEMLTLEESDIPALIEADEVFVAQAVNIKKAKKPFNDDNGDPVFKIEFKFVLEDEGGEHDGQFVWGETGVKFSLHPDCRLTNWAQEILGVDFEDPGYKLDLDLLLNERVKVVIGVREWNDKTTGELKRRNFVKDLMRVVKQHAPTDDPF